MRGPKLGLEKRRCQKAQFKDYAQILSSKPNPNFGSSPVYSILIPLTAGNNLKIHEKLDQNMT